MRTPAADDVMAVCSEGAAAPPWARSARMARLAQPQPQADLDADTPGERNFRLLSLRRALLGPRLPCVVDCPACGTLLDLDVDLDALLAQPATPDRSPLALRHGDSCLALRLPAMRDVAQAAAQCSGVQDLAVRLARRCVTEGEWPHEPPAGLLEAASSAFERADPFGALTMAIACPACAGASAVALDPGALLWQELGTLAESLLDEVHLLARAYGWSEQAILALPAARRRSYLARVGA